MNRRVRISRLLLALLLALPLLAPFAAPAGAQDDGAGTDQEAEQDIDALVIDPNAGVADIMQISGLLDPLLADFIAEHESDYARYPANAAIYLPGGKPPQVGDVFVQSDLAGTIQAMADAECAATGARENRLQAAHDAFYRGDIAHRIADYHSENGGLMAMDDLAGYEVRREPPLSVRFRGHDVLTCGAWCQGISFAQLMALLDLDAGRSFSVDDPARLHRLIEAMKLVFADREAFVADPAYVTVPVMDMLDDEYLRRTLARIDPDWAFPGMPEAGDIGPLPATAHPRHDGDLHIPPDTSHVCVIDREGNMFAATPSDTSCDTEVIPGLGICPSSRGSQSRGVVGHLNAVTAGKCPRLTPNPALVLKNDAPFLAFGTPGGDVQIQAMAQVLLAMIDFDMPLDDAVAAPRVASYSFPSSFAPNEYLPGRVMVEEPLADTACDALAALGHDAQAWPHQTWKAGGICAVQRTADGMLVASADPRRAGKAGGR